MKTNQGDQIGRIFASLAIVYSEQFLKSLGHFFHGNAHK
jgi:hypothetical protein